DHAVGKPLLRPAAAAGESAATAANPEPGNQGYVPSAEEPAAAERGRQHDPADQSEQRQSAPEPKSFPDGPAAPRPGSAGSHGRNDRGRRALSRPPANPEPSPSEDFRESERWPTGPVSLTPPSRNTSAMWRLTFSAIVRLPRC